MERAAEAAMTVLNGATSNHFIHAAITATITMTNCNNSHADWILQIVFKKNL